MNLIIFEDEGLNILYADESFLGQADEIKVNYKAEPDDSLSYMFSNPLTTIFEGKGEKNDIIERIKHLKEQKENNPSDYDKEKLQERIDCFSFNGGSYTFPYKGEE